MSTYSVLVVEREDGMVGIYRCKESRMDWFMTFCSTYDSFLRDRNWKPVFRFTGLPVRGCNLVSVLKRIGGDEVGRPVKVGGQTKVVLGDESGAMISGTMKEVGKITGFDDRNFLRQVDVGGPVAGLLICVADACRDGN